MQLSISDYYKKYGRISTQSAAALEVLAQSISYSKGYLIHREGQVSRSVYLIVKGVARVFYYRNGNDVTNQFFTEGEAMAAMESLYTGKPSFYNIELLEDCDLVQVDYAAMEKLYDQYHDLESCGRLLAIECYLEENERNRFFQMLTAKDRYLNLLKTKPEILQRVKLGHIEGHVTSIRGDNIKKINQKKGAIEMTI
ncbi:MAG: cyclic nucleotide-binding domain-containing protein [Bacteroidota bacterium]